MPKQMIMIATANSSQLLTFSGMFPRLYTFSVIYVNVEARESRSNTERLSWIVELTLRSALS